MKLRVGLYVTAALLMAAHFLRQGSVIGVALCLAAPLLFLWSKRWVLVVLQVLAYGAAARWVVTALHIVEQRQLDGRAWTAAALILSAVALLSLGAGLLLNARSMWDRYPR